MAEFPWMKFYPGDWLGDQGVRFVSPAARGLWIDLICLMHRSPLMGRLLSPLGRPLNISQIARATATDESEASNLISELEDAKVFSRDADGTIVCRRMIKDENKRKACADAGKKGGGNPSLKSAPLKVDPKDTFILRGLEAQRLRGLEAEKPEEEAPQAAKPPTKKTPKPDAAGVPIPGGLDVPPFREAWAEFLEHRRQKRAPMTEKAAKMQLRQMSEWGPDRAVAAIQHSVANGWTGVFEDKHNGKSGNGNRHDHRAAKRQREYDESALTLPGGPGLGDGDGGAGSLGSAAETPW